MFLGNKLHIIIESKSLFCSGNNCTIKLYDHCIPYLFICHASTYFCQVTDSRETGGDGGGEARVRRRAGEMEEERLEEVEEEKLEETEEEKLEERLEIHK